MRHSLIFVLVTQVVLTHSRSQCALQLLTAAKRAHKRVTVLVTESRPACYGEQMASELQAAGIPATVILDAAVGFFISKVDVVLFGAEAVCENGGIVNTIGTYQIAVLAKQFNKTVRQETERQID